ncbi:NTP transferase domain-containing protein [Agromyces bauzanensis]|uniref:NTP transferase domain-containing protein n=1 Tax=Agromyces bauzanensis TaxID=1308924 RepID=UPI0031EC584E
MRWTVVIPVKAPASGKSRLVPGVTDAARAALARAFALDTIAAARAARSVERVIVVGDDPDLADGAEFLAESPGERGLLPAIRHGIAYARTGSRDATAPLPDGRDAATAPLPDGRDAATAPLPDGRDAAVAVLLGDLPALTADELDSALEAASRHPLAFVRDADGTGTTLATAAVGVAFDPQFGPGSAARHAAAGFVELEASGAPGLTRDVDTVDGLETVLHHGVGDHTADVVAHLADRKGTA